jgi:hypothetical protein
MTNRLLVYAERLDAEVLKLPDMEAYRKKQWGIKESQECFEGFVTTLEELLSYLGAKEIREYWWHQHMKGLEFKHMDSKYFSLGHLASSEGVTRDEKWKGVVMVGFDEDLDYENSEKPDVVAFYTNEEEATDLDVYHAKYWRKAIQEFFSIPIFDISRVD